MLAEFSLEGKKAFVTGAGRGIGKAIAVAFAEAGAEVTLVARTEEQLEESGTRSETWDTQPTTSVPT